jgi:hypothetical protein
MSDAAKRCLGLLANSTAISASRSSESRMLIESLDQAVLESRLDNNRAQGRG